MALSMTSSGVTQTGQPGPWTSSTCGGQQLIDAVAHEGVGLAAADFHQDPGPRDGAGDFRHEGAGELGIAVLVDVLHGGRLLPGWYQEYRPDVANRGLSRKCEPPPVTDETGMGSAVFAEPAASPVCHRVHGHTGPYFHPRE